MTTKFLTLVVVMSVSSACLAQRDENWYLTLISTMTDRIRLEGPKSEYLKTRGWAYFSIDSTQEAIRDYTNAIALEPLNSVLICGRGDAYYNQRSYDSAIRDYSRAISIAPDSLDYYVSRGVSYEQLRKFNKALEDYEYVLKKNPNNELALRNRAILFSNKLNEFDKGIDDWRRLISAWPTAENFNDRGLIFLQREQYKNAVADFTIAISKDKENAGFFSNRGYCLGMIGEFRKAFDDFSTSQRIDPSNAVLFKRKGQIYLKMGDTEMACVSFQKAIRMGISIDHSLTKGCKIKNKMTRIFTFLLVTGGAFIVWIFKGMHGPFHAEASGQLDRDFKYYRNFTIGLSMLIVVGLTLRYFLSL